MRSTRRVADASASDARLLTKARLGKDLKPLELDIAAYCQGLDAQDQQESGRPAELGGACDLHAKLAKLKAQQARKRAQVEQLEDRG